MNEIIMQKLQNNVVAVIRIKDYDLAKAVTEEVINAGFNFIELTLSIDNCPKLIKELSEKYKNTETFIGAGTVMTLDDCKTVMENGATFVVSPFTNPEVITHCVENKLPVLPGVGTATEANTCNTLGCDIVKVFPGDVLGPNFIKSLKGPMPHIKYMPSGGVNLDNMTEWFEKGAYAVSVGSALYTGVNMDNLDLITDRAKSYLDKLPK